MSKKMIMNWLCLLLAATVLGGCGNKGDGYQQYLQAQQAGQQAYYEAAAKPLVDISLPAPGGQEYHIVVNREVRPLTPEQERPSEWAPVASQAIGAAGVIGGIYAGASLVEAVAGTAGTQITNSGTMENTGNGYTISGSGSPVVTGAGGDTTMAPEEPAVETDPEITPAGEASK